MSRRSSPQAVATLKQISYRIASTPVERLPQIAPSLAGLLWNCRDLLASTSASTKQGSDDGMLIHRLNVQLTTLLQDRTIQGRWSAVVLTKAIIEAGGLETLSKSNGWVKNLLAILKKPDPPTTRSLTVITLTRIFTLTWDHSNLIREITTPALPTFISTCLSNVERKSCSPNELQTVLEAFAVLVPRHPATFRTFEGQIRNLCKRIISNDANGPQLMHYNGEHRSSAQSLLVALHCCAPKQGGFEKWDETFKTTITAAHATCDRVFRGVIEDWKSTSGVQPSLSGQEVAVGECQCVDEDAAGLSRWSGIYAGVERLNTLVDLIGSHIQSSTAGSGPLRLGMLMDLLTRVCGVIVPTPGRQDFTKPNQQISKDERDALYTLLPGLHVAVLRLANSLLHRFGTAITSVIPGLLYQTLWIFRAEKSTDSIRTIVYSLLANILGFIGPALDKDQVNELDFIARRCCNDLLADESSDKTLSGSTNGIVSRKLNNYGSDTREHTGSTLWHTEVERAAAQLLPVLLSKLSAKNMPRKLRTQIDRTATLTKHKDALIASVLNPAPNTAGTGSQASLLPFLAKLFPGCSEVEAMLRPRMPVLLTGREAREDNDVEEEDEDDEDDEEEQADEVDEDVQATAEPDLLSALDEHLDTTARDNGSGDLSNTRPLAGNGAAPHSEHTAAVQGAAKRSTPPADVPGEEADRFTKRQRITLDPEPVTAPAPASAMQSTQEKPAAFGASLAAAAAKAMSDDGSDFELPPLTMEMDTESEDGDEDEDEGIVVTE